MQVAEKAKPKEKQTPQPVSKETKKPVVLMKERRAFSSTVIERSRNVKDLKQIIKTFVLEKIKNPKISINVNRDDSLKTGVLSKVRLWHYDIGNLRLYYRTNDLPSEIQLVLYGVFTHDETGTGTPPNIKKQEQFAKWVENSESRLVKFEGSINDPIIESYARWISNNLNNSW